MNRLGIALAAMAVALPVVASAQPPQGDPRGWQGDDGRRGGPDRGGWQQGQPDRPPTPPRPDTPGDPGLRGGPGGGAPDRGFDPGRDGRRYGDRGPGGYDGRGAGGYERDYGGDRGPARLGGDWRRDPRYDWRGWRDANRGQFRGPRYVAPRGWGYGYRRFTIGNRLPPYLYSQGYWLADPYAYRLPPAYGPYRWVRFYNDVLLIDLRSGAVVDEVPGLFW